MQQTLSKYIHYLFRQIEADCLNSHASKILLNSRPGIFSFTVLRYFSVLAEGKSYNDQ